MKRIFIILTFLFGTTILLSAKDSYFRGFYHGENVFIRNPYLGADTGFCIEEIYLNGDLLAENPDISAYEIDLAQLELDSRVVIRIVHHENCQPELANPEVIQEDLEFRWLKVYVDANQILWITTKESKDGFYIVEKDTPEGWISVDTVDTKGGIFINQHNIEPDHIQGDNLYRVQYHDPKIEVKYSETFNYYSDKEEISYAIDEENWIIEFTAEVSYMVYNNNSRIVKRGKDVSCNIQRLPRGKYLIKYDGKEAYFEKK
jgi:hypothetical protein